MNFLQIFALFFPAALVLGGAHLILKGYRRSGLQGASKAVRGRVSCGAAVLSPASQTRCAYARTLVERYAGGTRWIPVALLEARVPFSVGKKQVMPAAALFEVAKHNTFKGYAEGAPKTIIRRAKGALSGVWQRFVDRLRGQKHAAPFGFLLGFLEGNAEKEVHESDVIPKDVITSIIRQPQAGGVAKHLKSALRIREYIIPEGGMVTLLPLSGGETVVSDMAEENARSAARERAFLGIVAGSVSALVGILVALFIVL